MNELKPCPFCGNKVRVAHQSPMTEGIILCDSCKAMTLFPWHKSETGFDLKEAWNRRVDGKDGE